MDPISQLLIFAIIVVVNGWLIWYKQYETKKGENQALKEDIEELTEKVEQVKQDFNVNLEKVKAELQFLNTHQFSHAVEERNAIYGHLEAYHKWLSQCERLELDDLSEESEIQRERRYVEAYANFKYCESKLLLFPFDKESIQSRSKLTQKTLELAKMRTYYQFQIKKANAKLKMTVANLEIGKATVVDHQKALDEKTQVHAEFIQKSLSDIHPSLQALLFETRQRFRNRLEELFHAAGERS